jgi:predicted transposase YbfD/YdcC
MDEPHGITLVECLRSLPDPRDRRGRRYEWWLLVTVLLAGLVQEVGGVRAMADWAQFSGPELCQWLGVRLRRMPSLATLQRVPASLDLAALRERLQVLSEEHRAALEAAIEPLDGGVLRLWAMDGKAARGAARRGPGIRLVTLFDEGSGIPVDQVAVAEGGAEIPGGQALLADKDLDGVLVTGDALHCQRKTCKMISAQQGHYLIAVRGNQPELQQAIDDVFTTPPTRTWDPVWDRWVEEHVYSHGRLERRTLEVSAEVAWLDWPGAAQVLRRTYYRYEPRTGKAKQFVSYGITSLPPRAANAAQLRDYWRRHWSIENRLHWVKDALLAEDACQVTAARGAAALGFLRNMLVGLYRHSGFGSVATAQRHARSSLERTLKPIGAL